MFDDMNQEPGGDDEEFERRIDAASAVLTANGEQAIGDAESEIIADICDDDGLMSVDAMVQHVRTDRAQRAVDGLPSGAL